MNFQTNSSSTVELGIKIIILPTPNLSGVGMSEILGPTSQSDAGNMLKPVWRIPQGVTTTARA